MQPITLEERLAHVETAKAQLETEIPWIADTMTNDLKHALGDRPNSEFVIDPDGKVLHARSWSDPDQLRKDLAGLVGEVEKQTTIADLKRKNPGPKKRPAASGIVKRVPRPEGSEPLKYVTQHDPDEEKAPPFYAKLRIEAEPDVIETGTGKIHVDFHLDPIYPIHWNNLAKPLEFEIEATSGSVTPANANAAKVEEEADVDPREFLIDAKDLKRNEPLVLIVRYFACNDEEGWCKPVTQSYTIHLERDRDAGRIAGRGRGGPGGSRGRSGPGRGSPGRMAEMLREADANADGKVTREEFRGPERVFDRVDGDENGELSKEEIAAMTERFSRPPRDPRPGNRERGRPRSE